MVRQAHPMTETELQGTIVKMAEGLGWCVKPSSQGSQNTPRRPVKNRTANGFPDLVLARDGEVLFLELKTETGRLTTEQAGWQLALPHCETIRPSDLARGRVDELLA